jgi:hypothetical protein
MKEIYRELANKFLEANQNPKLYKKFAFTMEDLQDKPEVLEEIVEYLEKHKEKYVDYRILKWVDEATFTPQIMLELTLTSEYSEHINFENEKFIKYFYQRHESQFEIIKRDISHEELQYMAGIKDEQEALDHLINVHGLKIDKNRFYSADIITEVFQEGKENQRLLKPQLIIRLTQ